MVFVFNQTGYKNYVRYNRKLKLVHFEGEGLQPPPPLPSLAEPPPTTLPHSLHVLNLPCMWHTIIIISMTHMAGMIHLDACSIQSHNCSSRVVHIQAYMCSHWQYNWMRLH